MERAPSPSFAFGEKRRISSSGSSGTIAVILLLSFINKYLLATIRSQGGFFNRSPIYFSFSLPPRRPSIDPDEDGSLLFLTAVAELGYYFTPRYSSSVGVFLKFLFFFLLLPLARSTNHRIAELNAATN